MPDVRFSSLAADAFAGATIVLDVDGTLVPDGSDTIAGPEREALARIAAVARVYLCSNSRSTARVEAIAQSAGVAYLPRRYRKPHPAVIDPIPDAERAAIVVIGDLHLTDGMLARRLGAPFVRVARIRASHERLFLKLTYGIDGLIGRILR